jgi:50S ribosomal protein L16 3-hydroxylase
MFILDKFPTPHEFYKTYWGRKPFLGRGYIEPSLFDDFVDPNTLAGLSLEDDIRSRLVKTASGGGQWTCEHGPFEDEKYSTLDDKNWSILVQNVDQYHPETAQLLQSFDFAPKWLMDDIMVSYSTIGGSVGPHIDSYHVFLVQGIGKRTWTIGQDPIHDEECIAGLDLKVLKDPIIGETVDVETGDVIYIPPHFGHEGVTVEEAMTFSVGFLGPKMSELFVEYGFYLEQQEQKNTRYSGQNLIENDARFSITSPAQQTIREMLDNSLNSDDFSIWMAEYFSKPTHSDDFEIEVEQSTPDEILNRLQNGETLYRPDHIKLTVTSMPDGTLNLAIQGTCAPTTAAHNPMVSFMNEHDEISLSDIEQWGATDDFIDMIAYLYNHQALCF